MLFSHELMKTVAVSNCHEGTGKLTCIEMLAEYSKKEPGCKFVHQNVLEPGASIGEHTHTHDEELYIILEGEGIMMIDGVATKVRAGDLCYTRAGHSHSLIAGAGPVHFLVIGINL